MGHRHQTSNLAITFPHLSLAPYLLKAYGYPPPFQVAAQITGLQMPGDLLGARARNRLIQVDSFDLDSIPNEDHYDSFLPPARGAA